MYPLLGMLVLFCGATGYSLYHWHYTVGTVLVFSLAAIWAMQVAFLAAAVMDAFR